MANYKIEYNEYLKWLYSLREVNKDSLDSKKMINAHLQELAILRERKAPEPSISNSISNWSAIFIPKIRINSLKNIPIPENDKNEENEENEENDENDIKKFIVSMIGSHKRAPKVGIQFDKIKDFTLEDFHMSKIQILFDQALDDLSFRIEEMAKRIIDEHSIGKFKDMSAEEFVESFSHLNAENKYPVNPEEIYQLVQEWKALKEVKKIIEAPKSSNFVKLYELSKYIKITENHNKLAGYDNGGYTWFNNLKVRVVDFMADYFDSWRAKNRELRDYMNKDDLLSTDHLPKAHNISP